MTRLIPICCVLALLAGCDTPRPTGAEGIARAVEAGAPQAFYPMFPRPLFAAHEQGCTRPGDTFVRPDVREVRCETLLPPDVTGGLILEFDGTVEDLPKLITTFFAEEASEGGWIVTSDTYLRIPQLGGGVREWRGMDTELKATITQLFELSGGDPL